MLRISQQKTDQNSWGSTYHNSNAQEIKFLKKKTDYFSDDWRTFPSLSSYLPDRRNTISRLVISSLLGQACIYALSFELFRPDTMAVISMDQVLSRGDSLITEQTFFNSGKIRSLYIFIRIVTLYADNMLAE